MDEVTAITPHFCSECGRPTPPDELARFGERLICPLCKDAYAQKLREGVAPARASVYGGFWIRFVAIIIDGIILAVVQWILNLVIIRRLVGVPPSFAPGRPPEEFLGTFFAAMGIVWLVSIVVGCSYETYFVTKFGATPGKMALGLKIVRPDGGPIDVGRAIGRYFAKMLSAIIFMIGYIMAGFDSQKRALHDMICDTRVVRTQQ
jgi:uncharacterized RDD family membrane protein YckC